MAGPYDISGEQADESYLRGVPVGATPSVAAPSSVPTTRPPLTFNYPGYRPPEPGATGTSAPLGAGSPIPSSVYDEAIAKLRKEAAYYGEGGPIGRFFGHPLIATKLLQQAAQLESVRDQKKLNERQVAVQESGIPLNYARTITTILDEFSKMDPEVQKQVIPVFGPLLQKLNDTVMGRTPEGEPMIPNNLLAAMASIPGAAEAAANIYLNDSTFMPERKELDAAVRRIRDPEKVFKFLEDTQKRKVDQLIDTISSYLPGIVSDLKKTNKIPTEQRLDPGVLMKHLEGTGIFSESPLTRRAINYILSGQDARSEGIMTNSGLMPPSSARKILESKEKTKAPTLESIVGTGGAAGAILEDTEFSELRDKLTGELGHTPEPGEAFALLPANVQQRIMKRADELLQSRGVSRFVEQGKAMAHIRLETPEKASPKERATLAEDAAALDAMNDLAAIYSEEFVGPLRGRAGGVGELTGVITPQEAEFRAKVTTLKNTTIKLITGAQMSEPEAKRIMQQIPDVTNPPVTFEARLRATEKNIRYLAKRRREIMEKTGVDTSKMPPLPESRTLPGGYQNAPTPKRTDEPTRIR